MLLSKLFALFSISPVPQYVSDQLTRLRDRDLADLGLSRLSIHDLPSHAPVDVPNDRA